MNIKVFVKSHLYKDAMPHKCDWKLTVSSAFFGRSFDRNNCVNLHISLSGSVNALAFGKFTSWVHKHGTVEKDDFKSRLSEFSSCLWMKQYVVRAYASRPMTAHSTALKLRRITQRQFALKSLSRYYDVTECAITAMQIGFVNLDDKLFFIIKCNGKII